MNSNTKLVLGILGAVAAGAVIGLLLAPEKGSDTRKKIGNTANDWGKQLGDLFASTKTEMMNLKDKASRMAGEYSQKATDTASRVRSDYNS